MVKDIDDMADDLTRGIKTAGEEYYETFLSKRSKTVWAPYIDETAKDLSAGVQISDISLARNNFGREVGEYYRRGLKKTAGRHADLPSVLDEQVSDEKLGLLAYQLNEFSYDITKSNLEISDIESATEAVIEKILTRHLGDELTVSFDLSGATVSDITTQLFSNQAVAANVDVLLEEFEESAAEGLLSLMDEPQMMTPLWEHQRVALDTWCENGMSGYVDMATATGKTVLGLAALALQYGELHPDDEWIGGLGEQITQTDSGSDDILIVAHSDLILEQWRQEFENHLNIPQDRTAADDDIKLEWGTIHFRTPQSLVKQDRVSYDLVLLDEAHHYATGSEWGSLLDAFDEKILAMSGSVDDAGTDSDRIKERLENSVGPLAKRYTITEARADGVIPSFDWEVHYAPYDVVGDELQKDARRSDKAFTQFQKQLSKGDITVDTDRRLRTYEDIRNFSHTSEGSDLKQESDVFRDLVTRLFSRRTKRWNLSPVLDSVVDLVVEHYTTEKVVVLADSNAQVEEIESRLRDIVTNPSSIYVVSGSQDRSEQQGIIKEFDEPESDGILIGTGDLLGEGVNMQHASVAINMATGGVNQELVQRIGRVLRNPDDTPKHAMFYNVVGVPPNQSAAVLREDGKQIIEQAAGFCSLGHRFDKLPGFSISDSINSSTISDLLVEGAKFIDHIDSEYQYKWNKDILKEEDLRALFEEVGGEQDDAETILGRWEEYAWENSKDTDEIIAERSDDNQNQQPEKEAESTSGSDQAEITPVTPGLGDGQPRKETLIAEIKDVESELGEVPSKKQMTSHGDYNISEFENAFGTWSNAVREAGFEPLGSQTKAYTREDVVSGLEKIANELGKSPSVSDVNSNAEFSATVVYNYFESIGDARKAAGVEEMGEDESSNEPTNNVDTADVSLDPNPLSEHYELFYRLQFLIEEVIDSVGSTDKIENSDVLERWQKAVDNVAFGDGLADDSPHYAQQQSSQNSHTMKEYRAAYGNREKITIYQCVETARVSNDIKNLLIDQQIIDPNEQIQLPIAPESEIALPIIVSDEEELKNAIELLNEFPAEPNTELTTEPKAESKSEPEENTTSGTTSETSKSSTPDSSPGSEISDTVTANPADGTKFWDDTVDAISEYNEETDDITEESSADKDSLDSKIDEWKSQLLDLTRRNNLISFTPTKSKSLPIEKANPVIVANGLNDENKLYFRKKPEREDENKNGIDTSQVEVASNELIPTRKKKEAEESLSKIERINKQHLRERGVDSLYISLGMLSWHSIDHGDEVIHSPLFLAPVALEQEPLQDSDLHDYVLKPQAEGIRINPALRKKLAAERGINLPTDDSLSLDDVSRAFKSVNKKVSGFDRWSLNPKVVVGIFNFTKFSIYSDLERNRSKIKSNPIIQALNDDMQPLQQAEEDITTPKASELDEIIDPADMYQVLDADSSQQEAIEAAKRGKSFVLQGPPGTGKSQTIANIISEKLADGERVLFVSEKQAALNVVKSRLDDVGLGGFCLEVHGQKADSTNVLDSLETELRIPDTDPPENRVQQLEKLKSLREDINQYGDLLFLSPDEWELTVYDVHGIVSKHHDTPWVDVQIEDPIDIPQTKVDAAIDELETLSRYTDELENYRSSPWRHTTLRQWTVDTGDAMRQSINNQIEAINSLEETANIIEVELDIRPEAISEFRELLDILRHISNRPDISWEKQLFVKEFLQRGDQISELAEIYEDCSRIKSELSEKYKNSFFSKDGDELNNRLADYGRLKNLKISYRSLRKEITSHTKEGYDPNHQQLIKDTHKLDELQRIQSQVSMYEDTIQVLGSLYDGGDTNWERLISAHDWLSTLKEYDHSLTQSLPQQLINDQLPEISKLIDKTETTIQEYEDSAEFFEKAMDIDRLAVNGKAYHEASLSELRDALRYLLDRVPQLQQRVQFASQLDSVRDTICEDYVNQFLRRDHEPKYLIPGFKRCFYSQWLKSVYKQTDLDLFTADKIEGQLEEFRELDEQQQRLAQVAVQYKVINRRPTSDFDETPSSEEAAVRRQIEKEEQHKPLRELFNEAGQFITQITPCFMMSPLSVAQHLKSDSIEFDTVVFDEASQIMPQDAISSLIRADQAIITGDSKQLPPTSFFESDVETTESVREDLDSILEETASVLPEKTLRWHYRSRSEELIRFSNHHYYDNSLRTFPENDPDVETGVSFEYVENGVYDRGGSRQNEAEAERVVDLIEEHAEQYSNKSLGVVAFSSAQEQAIRDAVADRCDENSVLSGFVNQDDVLDEFFIKNLEMVQGDERDRMIFSVGYGPAQDGTLSTNFGPLNKSGGERRLNVAITRAKEKITVVCSMQPGDIDLSNSNSTGAQHFKDYLQYVKDGTEALVRNDRVEDTLDFNSEFEEAVYDALEKAGHDVISQVQSSSYSIDLAIKHPNQPDQFVLGIECDGAAYHSSKTARDRDRTRQLVLEGLGWNIHRIWSPDWVSNQQQQVQEINKKVDSLVDDESSFSSSPDDPDVENEAEHADSVSNDGDLTDYTIPSLEWDERYSPDMVAPEEANKNSIEDTVVQNGPIDYESAIRTYLQVWSESEITDQVKNAFDDGVNKLVKDKKIFVSGEFLWPQRSDLEFTVRVNTESDSRSIDQIAIEEIAKAGVVVLKETNELTRDELCSEIIQTIDCNDNLYTNQQIEQAIDLLDEIGALSEQDKNKISLISKENIDTKLLNRIYK